MTDDTPPGTDGTGPDPDASPTLRDADIERVPPARAAYDVPEGAPVARCPDCDRPFPDESLLALHRGLEHDERLDAEAREGVRSVRGVEERSLRLFRLRALAVLVVLYFGILMTYALVT